MSSADLEEEEESERILFMHREVKVYRIPPRVGTRSYSAAEWVPPHGEEIATCRMRIVSKGIEGFIRLEDSNTGDLFAETPILEPLEKYVEPCLDSSRYFVLRVEDRESGGHAFLGAGFLERGAAFDFNVALQDHIKYLRRGGKDQEQVKVDWGPMQDLTLKEGETIKVTIGGKAKDKVGAGNASGAAPQGTSTATSFAGLASPPPPAPSRHKATSEGGGQGGAAAAAAPAGGDDWADFGDFESAFDDGNDTQDAGFAGFGDVDYGAGGGFGDGFGAPVCEGGEEQAGFGPPGDWASFGDERGADSSK